MIIIFITTAIILVLAGTSLLFFSQQSTILTISISIAVALLASIVTLLFGYQREEEKAKKAPTLENRIATLTENLKSSSSVISEIEAEIGKRSEIAERLKNDVQRYEQLRELNQSQVEAIAQTIRSEITGESRKSIWRNALITFVIALVFFFLGLWVGSA